MAIRGHIKRLQTEKRYGFIRDATGKEYFFHQSGIADGTAFEELTEGQAVEFDPDDRGKGPRAENIVLRLE